MILRRIADAIREQNWFTVIIEILIVVIGIFLGLQVTEWGQERQNREREREYLQRVAQDLDQDYTQLIAATKFANFRGNEAKYLLNSRDFNTVDPCRFVYSLFTSVFFLVPTMARQTFDEMVSSGGLTLIQNNVVKDAMGKYYAYERQLEYAHENVSTMSHSTVAANVPYISVEWSRMTTDTALLMTLSNATSIDDYPETCEVMPMDKIIERHTQYWENPEVSGWVGPLSSVHAVVAGNLSYAATLNRQAHALVLNEMGEAP